MPIPVCARRYASVRDDIRDGDVLLWLPTSIAGKAICWGTRQPYSHASMAGRSSDGRLRNVEMVQWAGGRRTPLSEQVIRYPGTCQVWRPIDPRYDGHAALVQMLWLIGQPYGWSDFALVALHRICPRMLRAALPNSSSPDRPRVCSPSVAWAIRTSNGIAAVPSVPDDEISPGDLADSGFAAYRYSLYP